MISIFFYLLSSLTCVIVANTIPANSEKIIDIVHNNLPTFPLPYLSDFLVLLQTIYTVTFIDSQTLSEMFFIMGITQVCRVLCIASTILPPLKNYHEKYRLGGINGSGTEYIFSGHAAHSALSAIYLYDRAIVSPIPLVFYNCISQFLIVLTRNHYTVDVILAWIIVPLIYGNVKLCSTQNWCAEKLETVL